MPKIPPRPVDLTKNSDGSIVKPGALRWWRCPVCKIKHYGMSTDVCRTKECKNFGKGS